MLRDPLFLFFILFIKKIRKLVSHKTKVVPRDVFERVADFESCESHKNYIILVNNLV